MFKPAVRQAVHIVSASNAVKNVGFKHGVKGDAAQLDAIVRQDTAIVLQVLPDFVRVLIFQQRLQQLQRAIASYLIGGIQVIVGNRNICRHTRFNGKRQANQIRGNIVQAVSFSIEGKDRCFFQLRDPLFQRRFVQNRHIVIIRKNRSRLLRRFIDDNSFLRFCRRLRPFRL